MRVIPITGIQSDLLVVEVFTTSNCCVVFEMHGKDARLLSEQFLKSLSTKIKTVKNLEEFKQLIYSLTKNLPVFYSGVYYLNHNLCVVNCGDGQVWLQRSDKKALLASHKSEACGKVVDTDVLLLLSPNFKEFIEGEKLTHLLNQSVYAIHEELKTISNIQKNPASSAVISFLPIKELNRKPFFEKWRTEITHFVRKLKPGFSSKKIRFIFILLILLAILIFSIVMGLEQRKIQQTTVIYKNEVEEITHLYEEGTALIDLNVQRSRELLTQALEKVVNLDQKLPDGKEKKELQFLKDKIEQSKNFASRQFKISPEIFFDLTLIKPEASGTTWSFYENIISILDTKNSVIYRLQIPQKASQILIADPILSNALRITQNSETLFILADDVWKPDNDKKMIKLISRQKDWQEIKDIASFGNNLYFLDKTQIWKYSQEGKQVDADKYLLSDSSINLEKANNLTIDGAIWVSDENKILKLIQGRQDVWEVKGLDKGLGKKLRAYTAQNLKYVYILDYDNKQVVMVGKDGIYNSLYQWNEEFNFTDFLISEEFKIILVLSGSKIYNIDLK